MSIDTAVMEESCHSMNPPKRRESLLQALATGWKLPGSFIEAQNIADAWKNEAEVYLLASPDCD